MHYKCGHPRALHCVNPGLRLVENCDPRDSVYCFWSSK